MAELVAPLAFSLGGEAFAPFIVNLEPSPNDAEVSAADPIRLSVRDVETFVVAGQLQVSVGYARVRAGGTQPYDESIDGAFLTSVLGGSLTDEEAAVVTIVDGVEMTKTLAGPQKSVYAAGSALVPGDQAAIATAEIRPDLISADAQGAVLGLEHGFRNTAAYMFFTNPSGLPSIRIAGPKDGDGVRSPDFEFSYDWTSSIRRYLILWNEIKSRVEFYVVSGGGTELLHTEPIASFQEFDTSPLGSPTPRRGDADDATLLWGIEGDVGDRVTFDNVAIATDVGFPIIGISRPGDFITTRASDELVRFPSSKDPRLFLLSPWFGPDDTIFSNTDPDGVAGISEGVFDLTKNTLGTTFSVYREEPGLLSSEGDGFLFEVQFSAEEGTLAELRGTGMGFVLYDQQTVWLLGLFAGTIKTVGLYKSGSTTNAGNYILPTSFIDWSSIVRLRFTADPRRAVVEMFAITVDDVLPIMSAPFDRSAHPKAADVGLAGAPGFLGFGHVDDVDTTGTLHVEDIQYGTLYQAYEVRDGTFPDGADPTWYRVAEGFADVSPLSGLHLLGGGYGPTPLGYYVAGGGGLIGGQQLDSNQLVLTNQPGRLQLYRRGAKWDGQRGAVFEARMQVTNSKLQSRTGLFMVLDDGLHAYMLSFVDTAIGKFVAVAVRSGLSSFIEKVGTTGEAAKLSFKLDWSQPHTYRMERRRLDGLYIFVDNDPEPRLVIPDSDNVDYPTSQFLSPTVAFGQFSKEGSTSRWDFARTLFSRGYEVAFKKSDPSSTLEEDLGNTQAIVVATAQDDD